MDLEIRSGFEECRDLSALAQARMVPESSVALSATYARPAGVLDRHGTIVACTACWHGNCYARVPLSLGRKRPVTPFPPWLV